MINWRILVSGTTHICTHRFLSGNEADFSVDFVIYLMNTWWKHWLICHWHMPNLGDILLPTVASIQTSDDLLQFSGNSMWRKKLFLFVTCFESKNIPNGMPGTLFSNRWVSIVEMIFKRMWSLWLISMKTKLSKLNKSNHNSQSEQTRIPLGLVRNQTKYMQTA